MEDVIKPKPATIKKYICPRCDDLLDEKSTADNCLNCGGYIKGIVPASLSSEMPEKIKSNIKDSVVGLIILLMGLVLLALMCSNLIVRDIIFDY